MTRQSGFMRSVAAAMATCAIAAMGLLSSCSSKSSETPTTTPSPPTEKSMTQEGPNSFAPTEHGTTPTLGANNNNTVSVPHPPGPPPGPGGEPGGPGAGRR